MQIIPEHRTSATLTTAAEEQMEHTLVESVEEAVLRELKRKALRPVDLLDRLIDEGYTTSEAKLALARLLHDGRIELTSDRVLYAAA